jgi:outer membrane protein assembly factor BamB
MKAIMLVCILVIFVFGISTQNGFTDEFDWPRWRGPNGDGISMDTDWNPEALAGGPKILWKVDVGGSHSNVAIKDNRLYTMGNKGKENIVYCLNAKTGKEIWRHSFERSTDFQSTPTIEGEYVYALSSSGILFCLNIKNGKIRWKKDLVSEYDVIRPFYGFAGAPVVEGDLLILTANNSGVALDKKTGEIVWGSDKPPEKIHENVGFTTGTDYATPVLYDYEEKRYAVISSWEGIHSVEVETGKVLWLYEWELYSGHQVADPLIFDNKVFITQYWKKLGCVLLDIAKGEPKVLWKNQNMSSNISSPVMIDGYIYGVEGGPEVGFSILRCLDVETGEVMWEEDLKTMENSRGPKTVSLMAADGKLIILEEEGTLRIAEATPLSYNEISSGDVLEGERKFKKFWTYPVLCMGKIYCRNYFGDLVCIDVSK